jgi:hypothetical protein
MLSIPSPESAAGLSKSSQYALQFTQYVCNEEEMDIEELTPVPMTTLGFHAEKHVGVGQLQSVRKKMLKN